MITIPGQLSIKTIHGRNGDFNVGRLATNIGEFVIKNAELEQYSEGKYLGDFIITEIRPSTYNTSGRMVIEIRAHLGGMAIESIDNLSKEEASQLSTQEVDPLDEETPVSVPQSPVDLSTEKIDPLTDTTPFGIQTPQTLAKEEQDDATLFSSLWPLGEIVKLDATVSRRLLRQQRDRLDALGYTFKALSQDWHLNAA
ncbi:DUF3275 family protein [Serratia fonticola]|uniref:DUF3275 family protein n=1 Tax=Serratia fonticola TaxID=47917 RepID=UPI00192BBA0A|nr:DUF3275 family protein [Serratia fonticola]MBL5862098.1 DUF3275 family protein [Serratia fonticola]